MSRFCAATQAWFDGAFEAPTAAQAGRLGRDRAGRAHAGRRADRLRQDAGRVPVGARPAGRRARRRPSPQRRCRVLYVCRSRRSPSTSSATCAPRWPASGRPPRRLGPAASRTSPSAMRSGDTPADERRAFARTPPDILITTPESLFLLLTSPARESLRGVETVIVDEVHAVAGTKRGAHLALSPGAARRAARPAGAADRAVRDRAPGRRGRPLPRRRAATVDRRPAAVGQDDRARGRRPGRGHGRARRADRRRGHGDRRPEPAPRASIWPHVEERVLDLIEAHRSTIVFANSRRLAERLSARLNEIAPSERAAGRGREPAGAAPPAAGDGAVRRRRSGAPRGDRPGAPRLGVASEQRGADRGGAQGRPAAGGRRHLQPGARHRHGRGRPGRPGRVAAVGGQRPAAGRPGRPPGRRGLAAA